MPALPILQSPAGTSRIRPSKTSKWRAGVLVVFHLLIAAHITYWMVRGSAITPVEPSEAVAFSRAGVVNAGLIFFATTIALTAVFGRFFCGWACHLVALQDASRWLLEKFGRRPAPLRARFLGWVPMISFLYLFIYPLYQRLGAGDPLFSGTTEMVTTDFWGRFPGWALALLTFFICGFAIIYFLGAKGFCTYACPYGAAFAAADRVSPMRIRVTDACEGCGHCTAVCTSNVRVHEEVRDFGMVTSAGCMKCMDCVSVCPNDALFYGFGTIPLLAKRRAEKPGPEANKNYSLPLWEELLLALAGFAGYLTFRGLYGAVPILMALGTAAIFAFLALLTARLIVHPHAAFKGWRLKRNGELLRAGRFAVVLLLAAHLFWAHSAFMRWTLKAAEHGYFQTVLLRSASLNLAQQTPNAANLEFPQQVLERYRTLERWGLARTMGLSARQASLALVVGDLSTATLQAELSIDRGEFLEDASMVLATAQARSGAFAAASEHYQVVTQSWPGNLQAHLGHGLMLAELGRFQEAAVAFSEGLKMQPSSPELRYNLALASAYSGDLDAAIHWFEQTLHVAPDHQQASDNLAGSYAQLGRFQEAREHLLAAIENGDAPVSTHLLLAQVLLELNLAPQARTQIENALSLEPNSREANQLLQALSNR